MKLKLVYEQDIDSPQRWLSTDCLPEPGEVLHLEDGFFYKVWKTSKTASGTIKIHLLQSAQSVEEALTRSPAP